MTTEHDIQRYRYERLDRALRAAIKRGSTPANAAKAAHRAICEIAAEEGQTPSIEVWIKGPKEDHAGGNCWMVCWEAGPWQWGVNASFTAMQASGLLVETYYGFDLLFWNERTRA